VNRAVRERLGHVGKGILYQLEHRKREFSPDDRIVFLKNAEKLYGVLNGYTGTVRAVAPRSIKVELDGGRTIDVDPEKYPHLEWGYAVVTHKAQGQGDPLAVVSLTKGDTARSAYVALTRPELELRVHTRMKAEGTAAPEKRNEELLEHLTSDVSMRPKDDALLFEQTVNRTGGPDTPWAKAVRRGLEQDADALRQQHRAEMNERFQSRGYAVTQLLEKTSAQRERAEKLDEPKREQRLAAIAAGQRRDMDKIDEQFALESFVSWTVRRRKDVEREAPFLEKAAERRERHETQRMAHEGAKREQKPEATIAQPPPAHMQSANRSVANAQYLDEDTNLAMHVRQELRQLGHRDDKLPTTAELVAQFQDLRTEIRRGERHYGTSEARRMAEIIHARGQSKRRGRGIG
jgi:hypothetical protein